MSETLYSTRLGHGRRRIVELTLFTDGGGEGTVYILGPRGGRTPVFYGDASQAQLRADQLRDQAQELDHVASRLFAHSRDKETDRG